MKKIKEIKKLSLKKNDVLVIYMDIAPNTAPKTCQGFMDNAKNDISEILRASGIDNGIICIDKNRMDFGVISQEDAFVEEI